MSIYFDRTADNRTITDAYHKNGVVVVKNLIGPEVIARMLDVAKRVVYTRARSAGIALAEGLSLDEAFNEMCAHDRALGGDVYTCLRHHPDAVKLITFPPLVDYVSAFLKTSNVYYAIDQIHFRIDRRSEERFALEWHQDYWWNNTTRHAVSVWYSLVDVPLELGPMRFLLGSHKDLIKVRIDPDFKVRWDQNRLFAAAEPIDELGAVNVPVQAGDVVFLDALAVHRSGKNTSHRNRWTVVTRYADMLDKDFVKKGWKSGVRLGYVSLMETDPEYIVNRDQVVQPA